MKGMCQVQRVMGFIDGFNLYHGLKQKHGRRYLWLDLEALVRSLLKGDQDLVGVTYFTARVRDDPPAERRQSEYLDALGSHCRNLTVVSGRFQEKARLCRRCGSSWTVYEEKETDVSIAIALLEHAVRDDYDTALVVSADSDLCPAVRALRRVRPEKRVVAVFPPRRSSGDLRRAVDATLTLGDAKVRHAQLPEVVKADSGRVFTRPTHWM
jgi:uncharacterized LabA/DUF88 family protein